ncbi:MAG: hypothetical protein ABIK61_05855 [candidate division WOR-3 bacterium]
MLDLRHKAQVIRFILGINVPQFSSSLFKEFKVIDKIIDIVIRKPDCRLLHSEQYEKFSWEKVTLEA